MVSTGSDNISRLNRDNSTVGVGNQTSIGQTGIGQSSIGIGMSISSTEGIGESSTKGIRIGKSLSAEVSSTCKSNCRLVSRDNSTIGVGHQVAGGRDCDA